MKVVEDSTILKDIMGSDHCPVMIQVDLNKMTENGKEDEKNE